MRQACVNDPLPMLSLSDSMTRRTFLTGTVAGLLAASAHGATSPTGPRARIDLGYATATELAEAIRRKKISARELLEATFQRIDRYNPKLNAIVIEFRDRALARAKEADVALAKGKAWGPLHGVPVTIKEAFAYEGSPNTWGRPELKGVNSPRTAVAVERLESAGAIVIGKTNIPTGLADIQTFNSIYGTTNSPWDLTRTPGGSTGGGAAAVSAGLGPLTLGSDFGGSIRTPAHLCGVYGHKPTINLVSVAGHQAGPWDGQTFATLDVAGLRPGEPIGRSFDLQVAGPLARDARDLALALNVLGGPAGDEALAWTWRMPPPRHTRLHDFRIGYVMGQRTLTSPDAPVITIGGARLSRNEPIASDVLDIYEKLLSALARAGARLEQGWPAGIDFKSQIELMTYLGVARFSPGEEQLKSLRQRLETNANDPLALAYTGPHSRWIVQTERQRSFRAAWQAYFRTHDVFLLPPAATAAFPHDHTEPSWERSIHTPDGKMTGQDFNYWSVFASVSGLPATVAPVGRTRSGLPAGIQILAPMWEDGTSIEFAALLADLVGGFAPPPGYES
jgi:amidase